MSVSRRWWALGAALVLVAALGVCVVHPWLLLRSADAVMDADPCAFGGRSGAEQPPGPAYFAALDELAYVAAFPWFERLAADLTQAVSMRCFGNFAVACQQVKAAAEDAAVVEARAALDRELKVADNAEAAGRSLKALRDDPTRDWREHLPRPVRASFCSAWRPFIDRLLAARVDVGQVCPVCE